VKKIGLLALALVLVIGLFPGTAMAAGGPSLQVALSADTPRSHDIVLVSESTNGTVMNIVPHGSLTVSLAPNNPVSQGVEMGSNNVSFLQAKLTAVDESILVSSIPVVRNGGQDSDITQVKLYDGNTKLGEVYLGAETAGKAIFRFPPSQELMVDRLLTPKIITIKADVADYRAVKSGTEISFSVDCSGIVAVGANSGRTDINVSGNATGNPMYLFQTIPTVSLNANSPTGVSTPGLNTEVFRFDVNAANTGFDLVSNSVNFTLSTNVSPDGLEGKVFRLYTTADLSSPIKEGVVANGGHVAMSMKNCLVADKSIKTFVLKGDTSNMSGTLIVSIEKDDFWWNDSSGNVTNKGVVGLPVIGNMLFFGGPQPTQPSITVLSPNGGETWIAGKTCNITWREEGLKKVTISLWASNNSRVDASGGYSAFAISPGLLDASQGNYQWTVPAETTDNKSLGWDDISGCKYYKIAIDGYTEIPDGLPGDVAARDVSDNYFSIVVLSLRGDVNGDGAVNALDITALERIIAGLD